MIIYILPYVGDAAASKNDRGQIREDSVGQLQLEVHQTGPGRCPQQHERCGTCSFVLFLCRSTAIHH